VRPLPVHARTADTDDAETPGDGRTDAGFHGGITAAPTGPPTAKADSRRHVTAGTVTDADTGAAADEKSPRLYDRLQDRMGTEH
jgi:hypothetical protein